jgi:carbonic anhydrase
MKVLRHLFENNLKWANAIKAADPDFFLKLSHQQNPEYLWIGCADSRVPANQIVGLMPGEVFVHRNIANVVAHGDLNCLSVLQYAVDVLKVKHIIVCGHYGCGGIKAALDGMDHGLIDNWLSYIQDVYRYHKAELEALDAQKKNDRLCELNIVEQVYNICQTSIVRNAWASGQAVDVHGWIYRIEDGILQDMGITVTCPDDFKQIYHGCNGKIFN